MEKLIERLKHLYDSITDYENQLILHLRYHHYDDNTSKELFRNLNELRCRILEIEYNLGRIQVMKIREELGMGEY